MVGERRFHSMNFHVAIAAGEDLSRHLSAEIRDNPCIMLIESPRPAREP